MDPMTDQQDGGALQVEEFYDKISRDYDEMTGFSKRFMKERPYFHVLVETHKIKTAVDAGCGTGFHSLLLAQLGVGVTAVDISLEMLERVQRHAKNMGLHVQTVQSTFELLSQTVSRSCDALFCLGNSLAHLISDEEILGALKSFYSVLNPRGLLFLQILNYDRIRAQRQRIQNVKEVGNKIFIRFYDYGEGGVWFNILSLTREKGGMSHSLQTIRLRPLTKSDMEQLLPKAGFTDVQFYGGVSLEDYSPGASQDLVILARRGD